MEKISEKGKNLAIRVKITAKRRLLRGPAKEIRTSSR